MGFLHTDVPELRDYDTGVVLSNLAELAGRQVRLTESRLAQLYELAEAILHDAGDDPDVVDSILLSLQDESDPDSEGGDRGHAPQESSAIPYLSDVPESDRVGLLRMVGSAGLRDRLTLYRILCESETRAPTRSGAGGSSGSGMSGDIAPFGKGRVAYMQGAFADKAFLCFSAHIPNCRAAVFHSFVDACEEVYNGLCEFCILPLESATEGKLTAFSRLIIKYGLYTVAACDIENGAVSGHPLTRFGLLCRRTTAERYGTAFPPRNDRRPDALPVPDCLELLHTTAVSPSLTDLLTAADFCGLRLLRADTLSDADTPSDAERLSDPDARPSGAESSGLSGQAVPLICTVLDTAGASSIERRTFGRFLSLEAAEDIIMGYYVLL